MKYEVFQTCTELFFHARGIETSFSSSTVTVLGVRPHPTRNKRGQLKKGRWHSPGCSHMLIIFIYTTRTTRYFINQLQRVLLLNTRRKNGQVHFLKWGCSPSSWGAELRPHRFTEWAPRMPHQAFPHPKLTWEWNRTRLSCQGISAFWIKTEDSRSQRYPNILKKWKHLSKILTKELLDSKSPFNPWLFTIIFLSYSEQNNRVIRDKLH